MKNAKTFKKFLFFDRNLEIGSEYFPVTELDDMTYLLVI